MIYRTAIEIAEQNGYQDIFNLLSKGPIKASKAKNKKARVTEIKDQSIGKDDEILQLKEKLYHAEQEILHLKDLLFALKEKSPELQFFNFDEYIIKKVIAEGATSSVKLVIKKENEKYAMKELKDFSHKSVQRFLGEGEILSLLHHPCILDIIAVNLGDDNHPPSLILSLEPKSLETAIANKELDYNQKCMITVELVLGMRYIHHRNYMHRDLKPSNILLSKDNHVRISDFGLAKEEDLETSQSKGVGTLRFMAPELFVEEDDGTTKYTNKVDVYSFGITLIYIITGSYPRFNMRNVVTGILPNLPDTISNWIRDIIIKCLSFEPEKRPSFDEIFEAFKINNYDIFGESKDKKMTSKQQNLKKEIGARVLMIEAFEFQHQND